MKLTEHLTPSLVKVPLNASDKVQAITELVDLMVANGVSRDREPLLAAVLERESQRTTGIGRGFAIPHAKTDSVHQLVIAFGRTAKPLDFGAIDGAPVQLIALLASPSKDTSKHIQALARLSRLAITPAIRDGLLAAKTADAAYQIIAANDAATP
ncbi:MAG TPA: PTS sugar transporter subunit IIA [Phycisphaerae bacterium]|nr:PTS sugar transporter subunit IIA [Phycisphaerae bacterium]